MSSDTGLDVRRPMLVLGLVVLVLTALAGLPGRPVPAGTLDETSAAALHARLLVDLPRIREAIGLYSLQHEGRPPGSDDWRLFVDQLCSRTDVQGAPGRGLGPDLDPAAVSGSGRRVETVPDTAEGGEDWLWCPRTTTLRVNRPGQGPTGVPWFDY